MIELRGVRKTYPAGAGRQSLLALDGIDLRIETGEFVCILGPSGCGKTTLLKSMMGLATIDAGEIRINNSAVSGPEPAGRKPVCAMVFQNFALLPWADVLSNVAFGLELRGVAKAERERTARQWIEAMGLQGFEHHYPRQLSGGMQQRVGLGRAMAVDPDILLMDEPFGALDEQTRRLLQEDLMKLLERTRKTVVFVTHSLDEAVLLADRVVLMSARPRRIQETLAVNLPRPRTMETQVSPSVAQLKEYLWDQLRGMQKAIAP